MELYKILEERLRQVPAYVAENSELKKWLVINKAQNYDDELIGLLLDEKELKAKFFINVKKALVFNQSLFLQFLEQKNYLKDSYTAYKNKIGLNIDGKFLSQRNEVSLVWPFKDCILEGGQSRDEDKRQEIFFNEILAQDEITQLLEPKVVTNAKRYNNSGEKKLNKFNRDAEGVITDNLIIKGNNLLALHSLKKEFSGRVKLIYLDPPYNTGKDSFQYNDRFNESTWLTFMRNRLVVARDMLADDGILFIQCDDHEQAYLKILMDDVFNSKNFVETFVWKNTDNAPALSKKTRKNIEFIHCYEKVIDATRNYIGRNSDNDDAPLLNSGNSIAVLKFSPGIIRFRIPDGVYKKGVYDKVELLDDLIVADGKNKNLVSLKGRFKWQQSFLEKERINGTYFIIKTKSFSIRYKREVASNMAPDKLLDESYLSKALGVETNEDSKKHIDALGLKFNSYPKPETLISFLMKAVTDEHDLVMDYHLGSGTTAAVAHKLNRQYIGIEQMDYIEDVAIERLKKVIAGESGGISEKVDWKGGGEFVFLELKKYNQAFIDQIRSAKNTRILLQIWEEMKIKSFINYNVDIKKQEAGIEDFKKLSLNEQKQYLSEILDKNQLYVNLSSLNDQDFACTEYEKLITNDFYRKKI